MLSDYMGKPAMIGLLFLIVVVGVVYLQEVENNRAIKKYWDDWQSRSFEWKGYRISRDFYEIVDGELREKPS